VGAAAPSEPELRDSTTNPTPAPIPAPIPTAAAAGPVRAQSSGSSASSATSDDPGQPAHDLATAVAEGEFIADAARGGVPKQSEAGDGNR
jgi:hypothetical protein